MSSKKTEKKFFAIFSFIVVSFMFIAPYLILPKVYEGRSEWLDTAPPNAVFLELWEIDTFEGGNAGRARFLEKTAYLYQDITLSTYVLVRSLELEQAKSMLENGTKPDMISFGIGAGDILASLAHTITSSSVRSDLQAGGIQDGSIKAVPWCFGGYLLCSTKIEDLSYNNLSSLQDSSELKVIGTGYNFNQPNKTLTDEELSLLDKTERTQYKAYESFLRGNEFQVLLGTQRDFHRLNNKVNLGVLDNVNYRYLDSYTDLIQYISITTPNPELIEPAHKFINYLTSHQTQKRLTSIGMFGVNNEKIYTNEYQDFENALSNKLQVTNVFTSNVTIKEKQKEVFQCNNS